VARPDGELSSHYQTVAIDQRGYNLSGKPKGVDNYDMSLLVADVAAVIKHLGRDKAIIAGHDWGGAVAWTFATYLPQMTEKLIILNLRIREGCGGSWRTIRNSRRTPVRPQFPTGRRAPQAYGGRASARGSKIRRPGKNTSRPFGARISRLC